MNSQREAEWIRLFLMEHVMDFMAGIKFKRNAPRSKHLYANEYIRTIEKRT